LLADGKTIAAAIPGAFAKLDPRRMVRSPVMFTVEVGAVLITILAILRGFGQPGSESTAFVAAVAVGLWATVLFATFAESLAEGRGRAQADAMRSMRKDTPAKRLASARRDAAVETVPSPSLRSGDHVLIEAGDLVPGDGEVDEGVASVDESAITGESAPVIRESGGDRNTVTGGTRLLSDWLIVRITADPGDSFLDRMIGLIEGAKRQKTPNEIALDILLAGLTLVFLVVTATLLTRGEATFHARQNGRRQLLRDHLTDERARHVMLGLQEHIDDAAEFDHTAGVQHRHTIAHLLDDFHLVRDQHDGQTEFAVDLAQQVENRARRLRIQRGSRLIGEQHIGLARQRAGNANALLHAA
jgi:high-affinity K+ transport system ATPase subunit B